MQPQLPGFLDGRSAATVEWFSATRHVLRHGRRLRQERLRLGLLCRSARADHAAAATMHTTVVRPAADAPSVQGTDRLPIPP